MKCLHISKGRVSLLPSPSHPSGSSQCTSPECPVSCMEPGLAIYFIYDNTHESSLSLFDIPCFFFFSFLLIYFWLCWLFIATQAFLQLWQVGATLQLQSVGFSLQQLLFVLGHRLYSVQASVTVAHGLSSSRSRALEDRLNTQLLHGM